MNRWARNRPPAAGDADDSSPMSTAPGRLPESARPSSRGIHVRGPCQHLLTDLDCQHKLTPMEKTLELAEGAASNDPEVGLRAVAALRVLTERLEMLQVDNARSLGWSWQQIAARLGVTKQTVHRKHGRRAGRR
jgi:hypothetical protein